MIPQSTLSLEDAHLVVCVNGKKCTLLEIKQFLTIYISLLKEHTPYGRLAEAYFNFSDTIPTDQPSILLNIGNEEHTIPSGILKPKQALLLPPFRSLKHFCLFPFFAESEQGKNNYTCLVYSGTSEETTHRFNRAQDSICSHTASTCLTIRAGINLSVQDPPFAQLRSCSFLYERYFFQFL